jgi:hypothetical protein
MVRNTDSEEGPIMQFPLATYSSSSSDSGGGGGGGGGGCGGICSSDV